MNNKCNRRKNWTTRPFAEVIRNKYCTITKHPKIQRTWIVSINDPNNDLIACDCERCKE